MTIAEVIAELSKVPDDQRHLPLYVFTSDHDEIKGITLYAKDEPHGESNPLSIDI